MGHDGGTVAAELLADTVLGRENPWAPLYDSKRLKPRATAVKFAKESASTGYRFVAQRLARGEKRAADELAPGEGSILRVGGLKRAVYKDEGAGCTSCRPSAATCGATWSGTRRSAAGTAPATARVTRARAV